MSENVQKQGNQAPGVKKPQDEYVANNLINKY